jgi:hypothetical protein
MAYDDMSFGKAFSAARKEMGAGKTFEWKGKKYTTDMKGETKPKGASSMKPKARPEGLAAPKAMGGRGDGSAEMARRTKDRMASSSATVGASSSATAKAPIDKMAKAKADAEARRKKTQTPSTKGEVKKPTAVPSKGTGIMGFLKGLSAKDVKVNSGKKKK